MGLAYLGMSSAQGLPLLDDNDVAKGKVNYLEKGIQNIKCHFAAGLVPPIVAQKLLGTTGEFAILFLILMAVMSTGSAEVIAVASVIIYDIYQTYIKPFRPDLKPGFCIICNKSTVADSGKEPCSCIAVSKCHGCKVSPGNG